ncbi:MAG: aminoglycoside 6-adenylyltransferase [Chloroflexi bacterium]|nr:aminoglycoside 6-adenylyltransferase [Chloroflexota bacterium]
MEGRPLRGGAAHDRRPGGGRGLEQRPRDGARALTAEEALARFTSWAEREESVRALILLGSRARREQPADAWSDTDLVAFTTDLERWIGSDGWLDDLGDVVVTFTETTGLNGLRERRVMFRDGTDVDLVPVPVERTDEIVAADTTLPVLARGYRLLVDKDDRFADLAERVAGADPTAVHGAAPWPPATDHVLNEIGNYLYHCIWTAKKLRRGELAVAVSCQNGFQGHTLLRFIEWQAKARSDGSTNTFYGGRFLERWAVPDTVAALGPTQARYDADDLARSIVAGLALFGEIAREVAAATGAEYPEAAHEWTRATLAEILGD